MKAAYGRAADRRRERRRSWPTSRSAPDRAAEAYRQVLWALVTGPEFRFSY